MKNRVEFGLVGRNIAYSFSKKYFSEKFKKLNLENYTYEIFDLKDIAEIQMLFQNPALRGLNVTIPYKEKIIPFLDGLSAEATAIGAVNTISITNGKKTGHNTDAFGFEQTLVPHLKPEHRSALIFGDGGAAKAVKYVLDKHKIPHQTVSRHSEINFENLEKGLVAENKILVQCTPVGTFPNVENSLPIPYDEITENHLVIDLIYNPEETKFLNKASKNGAVTVNGALMLVQQAEKAWEIWTANKNNIL